MAKNWYAVQTFSNFENKAKLALEDAIRRAGLGHRFGEVLVPTEAVVEVKDGQKKTTTRKKYPGYMFVNMEIDNETWHLVTTTPKVAGFIGGSRNPPALAEAELRTILDQGSPVEEKPKPVVHFERGEDVRIIDGPFASMPGKVEEVNQARAKLRVLVTIFGRQTSVELDYTQVERPR
ncbi:MAG: transcription termination/antitermination protein NusG [Deltaproteobacteria bacterium]|jgi:transcriptional antiterminator NusG|nr:transcription termination/antitermination protein NusG [Deltaproteobacteria bacterium]